MDGDGDERSEVFGERELRDDEYEQYLAAPPPGAGGRQGWSLVGKAVAVVLILFGLVVVGFFVLMIVVLNSWGSNK